MGILNVTPDSFSDGGRYLHPDDAVRHAEEMVRAGARLIDIGGESTRPGAVSVPADEERRRVVPVIAALAKRVSVPLSIDTSKADVAQAALDAGASMVNDVTALRGDSRMTSVIAKHGVSVILMHMRGQPHTMQRRPRYRDVVQELLDFFRERIARAESVGIRRHQIFIDPGLGFGKTLAHNLTLVRHLDAFVALGYPVVVGPSRKSFIGQVLDAPVEDRLSGTLACVAEAARQGAQIVRVHDVKATVQFLAMGKAIHANDSARRQHRSRGDRAAGAARRDA